VINRCSPKFILWREHIFGHAALSAVFSLLSFQEKDKPARKAPLSDSLHKGEETLLWVSDCIIYAASAFAVVAVIFLSVFKRVSDKLYRQLYPRLLPVKAYFAPSLWGQVLKCA